MLSFWDFLVKWTVCFLFDCTRDPVRYAHWLSNLKITRLPKVRLRFSWLFHPAFLIRPDWTRIFLDSCGGTWEKEPCLLVAGLIGISFVASPFIQLCKERFCSVRYKSFCSFGRPVSNSDSLGLKQPCSYFRYIPGARHSDPSVWLYSLVHFSICPVHSSSHKASWYTRPTGTSCMGHVFPAYSVQLQ